ncbi:hypothetical protein Pcinc_014531 [Petrolisthes cinctipes]|uniref:Uncharacterized protein n=1 Tax=Petrolisthes cinctipes TaxID=88211 RepID=A0AAE1FXK2_PETCI|nr:hypothetical protein Pcinc_014531 [Petrolisthes cinctipes]
MPATHYDLHNVLHHQPHSKVIATQTTSQATPDNLPTPRQQHTHAPPHNVANLAQRLKALSNELDPQLQAPPLYHQQQ